MEVAAQAPALLLARAHYRLARLLQRRGHAERIEHERDLAHENIGERSISGPVALTRSAGADDQAAQVRAAVLQGALDHRLVQLRSNARGSEAECRRGVDQDARGAECLAQRAGHSRQRACGLVGEGELLAEARHGRRGVTVTVEPAVNPLADSARSGTATNATASPPPSAPAEEPASAVTPANTARKMTRLAAATPATTNARRNTMSTSITRSRSTATVAAAANSAIDAVSVAA